MENKKIILIAFVVLSTVMLFPNMQLKYALADTDIYSAPTPTYTARLDGSPNECPGAGCSSRMIGEEITGTSALIGQTFNKISFTMNKVNSGETLQGTVTVGIWDSIAIPTSGNYLKLIGTISANSVANAAQLYTFNFGGYTLTANDVVGVYYATSDAKGGLYVYAMNTAFDGTNTRATCYTNAQNNQPNSVCFNNGSGGQLEGWLDDTGSDFRAVFTITTTSTSTVCIDTNGDSATDVCFTDTNGDGVPDAGPSGALGAQRSNANITDFGSQMFCAFGISDSACSNRDIRTNGVGLVYLFLVIVFSYAVLVTIHHEAQKYLGGKEVQVMDALKINPLLLVIMLILDIGFTWYLHWISDIIFYTMIAVIAGITAFGIYQRAKSGGD